MTSNSFWPVDKVRNTSCLAVTRCNPRWLNMLLYVGIYYMIKRQIMSVRHRILLNTDESISLIIIKFGLIKPQKEIKGID